MSDSYILSHHVFLLAHMLGREYIQVRAPYLGSCIGASEAKHPASLRFNLLDAGRRSLNYFLLLLLIAALVTSLAKQFTVLLLGHTLAALLNNGTHRISSLF